MGGRGQMVLTKVPPGTVWPPPVRTPADTRSSR